MKDKTITSAFRFSRELFEETSVTKMLAFALVRALKLSTVMFAVATCMQWLRYDFNYEIFNAYEIHFVFGGVAFDHSIDASRRAT